MTIKIGDRFNIKQPTKARSGLHEVTNIGYIGNIAVLTLTKVGKRGKVLKCTSQNAFQIPAYMLSKII